MEQNSQSSVNQQQFGREEYHENNNGESTFQNDEVSSNENIQNEIEEVDSTDWERTNVESIKEVRDAQIETKMFEMHKKVMIRLLVLSLRKNNCKSKSEVLHQNVENFDLKFHGSNEILVKLKKMDVDKYS